jgi:hypothetical protein
MSRLKIALAALVAALVGGGGFALAQQSGETVEEHVVTFVTTIQDTDPSAGTVTETTPGGTVTETVTQTETSPPVTETVTTTVTETVTVTTPTGTTPTTTEPEPEPGEPLVCTIENRHIWGPTYEPGECVVGTTILRTVSGSTSEAAGQFRCSGPLSAYGPLPILVRFHFTGNPNWGDRGSWDLVAGCRGPAGDGAIDLIIETNASPYLGLGPCGGGGKFRAPPGPNNVQMTGNLNGGATCGSAHQDGLQVQANGGNMDLVNATLGDYDAGRAGAIGAGGATFFSQAADVDILGGEFVSCNHGLFGTMSSQLTVEDAKYRAGRIDSSDSYCDPFASPPNDAPCPRPTSLNGATLTDVSCQRWNGSTWVAQPGY